MDAADKILNNFGQWCEVEGTSVAPSLSLIVFIIDGKERGRYRLFRPDEGESESTLILSTSAAVLKKLAEAELPAQLAFLAGDLKLSGSPESSGSVGKVMDALCRANGRGHARDSSAAPTKID